MGNCGGKAQTSNVVSQPSDLPPESLKPDSEPNKVEPPKEIAPANVKPPKAEREVERTETTDSNVLKVASPPVPTATSQSLKVNGTEATPTEAETHPERKKLSVVTTQTSSDDNRALGVTQPPTPQQVAAAQRIQRLARNKSAWRIAEVEREWKVNCTEHVSTYH